MYQSVIRSRLLYGLVLGSIWVLIILVPSVAHLYHHTFSTRFESYLNPYFILGRLSLW